MLFGTFRIFGNLGMWIFFFKKMNLGFLEFLETLVQEFFKNEFGIFGIFGNLGTRIFKMNPGFLEFSETLVREFLKNESGIFGIFGNFGKGIFKKWIWNFWNFWKLGKGIFKMNPGFLEFSKTWGTWIF